MLTAPRTGEVVRVTGGVIAIGKLIRVLAVAVTGSTPDGCVWLTGYVLGDPGTGMDGLAVERREMFLDLAHLTLMQQTRRPTARPVVRNAGPVRVPIQRSNARPAAARPS